MMRALANEYRAKINKLAITAVQKHDRDGWIDEYVVARYKKLNWLISSREQRINIYIVVALAIHSRMKEMQLKKGKLTPSTGNTAFLWRIHHKIHPIKSVLIKSTIAMDDESTCK